MSVFCELSCKKEDKAMNLHIYSHRKLYLMPIHNRLVINSSSRCTSTVLGLTTVLSFILKGRHIVIIDGTLDNI